jgi:hypothetical protein
MSPLSTLTDCASNFTGESCENYADLWKFRRSTPPHLDPRAMLALKDCVLCSENTCDISCARSRTIGTYCCQQPLSFIIRLPIHNVSSMWVGFRTEMFHTRTVTTPSGLSRLQWERRLCVLMEKLQYSHGAERKALINSKETAKKYYNQAENTVNFREGNFVLFLQQNVRRSRSQNLSSPCVGPYTVKFQV